MIGGIFIFFTVELQILPEKDGSSGEDHFSCTNELFMNDLIMLLFHKHALIILR